ncbi:MAG TPA: hypothetical protein DCS15_07760 [Flavobacteriales bacterium]|nr:hypothetical protein [Flavobacteriales bacterium]
MGMIRWTFYTTVILIALVSCVSSSEKDTEKEGIVSSGELVNARRSRAELANLMRDLYTDLQTSRVQVKEGANPKLSILDKYAWIKDAHPTDAEDSGPVFEAYADGFIQSLRGLENTSDADVVKNYNLLVNSCIGCHQQYCIGPLDIIRKLEIK